MEIKVNKIYKDLIQIGLLFYSQTNLKDLLEKILDMAINIAHCEGGSLYIRENNHLKFYIAKNKKITGEKFLYFDKTLPINENSLAGYVAYRGEILNIKDAYQISNTPFNFDFSFDKRTGYRTTSVLGFPLKDTEHKIIGVLQLINATNEKGEIVFFSEELYDLLKNLCGQAAIALKNTLLMQNLKQAYLDTIYRLSVAAELKDEDTYRHLKAVSKYCRIISEFLNLDKQFQEYMEYVAPMHDIGKIGIPDSILKKEGKLTEEEREIMKQHTIIGAKIFENPTHPILEYAREIALSHHERYDGKGYPYNLKGKNIPLTARIMALADVYDALKSRRCYKPPFEEEKILEIIKSERGKHFDPLCVDAFFNTYDKIKEATFQIEKEYA